MTTPPTTRVVDLHLHTNYSDGTDTPQRVVELAHEAGLAAIAITDHDNVEAMPIAAPIAARYGLELVQGIEMSASTEGLEVHILGFLFDPAHPPLVKHLAEQHARRVQRVHEMVERLGRVGVTIEAEEVFRIAGQGTVGRPHVARALLKRGYVKTLAEAFVKYIGQNNPGFVPGSPIAPIRVIQLLREAGGVPVLAHPIYLKRDALIETFTQEGLVGLEVYHSSHTPEMVLHYGQVADQLGLLKTGGSDSHGDAKEGLPIGAVKASYALLDALRQWKSQHVPPQSVTPS